MYPGRVIPAPRFEGVTGSPDGEAIYWPTQHAVDTIIPDSEHQVSQHQHGHVDPTDGSTAPNDMTYQNTSDSETSINTNPNAGIGMFAQKEDLRKWVELPGCADAADRSVR